MLNYCKMLKAFVLLLFAFMCNLSYAQNVGINSTGAAPDASAMLDVASTVKGCLAPRMTTIQRGAIPSPIKGLLVYQIDGVEGFYYYNGSTWSFVTTSGTSGAWAVVGNPSQASTYNTGSFI